MNVKLVNKGTEGEVLLEGRLDSESAPGVEQIFNELVGRFDTITLNFKDLMYTSSAGLRIILRLAQTLNKQGKMLYISNVSESVLEVFEITGFSSLLNFK